MKRAPIALKNFFPLSLWERALARTKRIVFFLGVRRSHTPGEVGQGVYAASFVPHPNPLPNGEGAFQHALRRIALAIIIFSASSSLCAQTPEPQQAPPDSVQPQQQQQMNQVEQMLGPLNITSDQAVQIRRIYSEQRDERQAANLRLRLAQRALTEAIQSPAPDEALIGLRSKEVADAQANTIRIRSLTEARILQVLTPEQRMKLRQLRAQAMMNQRRNQQNNPRVQRRGGNALQPNQNQNQRALTPQQQRRLLKQSQQQRPR